MRWFGFGFNSFGQICVHIKPSKTQGANSIKVLLPTELCRHAHKEIKTSQVSASWSRTASLQVEGDSCVRVAGFGTDECGVSFVDRSRGCKDVLLTESHLTLAFHYRVECWDLQKKHQNPAWSLEIEPPPDSSGPLLSLPLVPGGYIAQKPPFYHSLSPHLKAKSLALGAEHAILLSATGAVYTWGLGSHGQLGHGVLTSEEEPRAVEALWGMTMSHVATGGWHSACISDGADLYVWGWNESGQLGLPSQALRKAQEQQRCQRAGEESPDKDVFISIQAFPALLDVNPSCDITTVSCGSRHTAAVTATGDLYTWGWGEYGQLGHQTLVSSDEPQRVRFFTEQKLRVLDVECGPWNTFTAVADQEVTA